MKASRAFTLVELLTVIAVVALLVALILPVLNRAKNEAAKTSDLNNLHQIMIAIHVYTDENQDSLTWPNWDYGQPMPDGTARAGWLYRPDSSATGTNVFNARAGLLWNALHGGKIFLCPMDQPGLPRYSASDDKLEHRAQQLSSFIMNGAVIGFRSGYKSNAPPVKITQMQPGDCVLFEADDLEPFSFNDGSSWPTEGVTARHQNGATWAAVDGSANYVLDHAWQVEVLDTNKNSLWCYPNTADGGDLVYRHNH